MSRRGFTIIELLVSLAIIALLAGLSASAFLAARRNYGMNSAAAEMQAVLRAARNTSISAGTPSFVVVDPVQRQVWAQSFETAGEWSFEEGGEGSDLNILDGEMIEGRIGRGVSFRGSKGYADCGSSAKFDLRTGLVLEAWIRHDMIRSVKEPNASSSRSRQHSLTRTKRKLRSSLTKTGSKAPSQGKSYVIIERPGSFGFELTEFGALIGFIGDYDVISEDDIVAPGRWVFVSLRYDGREIVLAADGVERYVWPLGGKRGGELPDEIPASDEPVTISSPEASFPGDIDEVRIRGRAEKLVYEHGPDLKILGWKRQIHFDRRGHLDASFHDGKVRIVLAELSEDQFQRVEPVEEEKTKTSKYGKRKKKEVSGLPDYSMSFDEWLGSIEEDNWPDEEEREIVRKMENGKYRDARKVVIEIDRLGVMR